MKKKMVLLAVAALTAISGCRTVSIYAPYISPPYQCSGEAPSSGFIRSWNNKNIFLQPYGEDAYGPGINSDVTGRPFQWKTETGKKTFGPVKPNAYGLGVGMDQFGRPVKAEPWP